MSDNEGYEEEEEEEEEEYEYPSEDDEDGEDDEDELPKAKAIHQSPWMAADDQDLRIWSEGSMVRLSIFSCLRQIVNASCKKRVLCSKDELFDEDSETKTVRVFLEVTEDMIVVYALCFNSTKAISISPPTLKCISYCGRGTYLFPHLLLPNCLGQFIDFGKVFDRLSRELLQFKSSFNSFIMVNEDSPHYLIQELAYLTQYKTSSVFDLEDSGIVTGLERTRSTKPGDGVGYSSSSRCEATLEKDDCHQYALTLLLGRISNGSLERIVDSPLNELLRFMTAELSVEEITRSPKYAEAIFNLIGMLQGMYRENSSGDSTDCGFSVETLQKLASFKNILSDEYGLQNITLPEEMMAAHKRGCRKRSPMKDLQSKKATKPLKQDDEMEIHEDPVIFIEELFTRHSYLPSSSSSSSSSSAAAPTGKALLKRMKVEFNTLSTSLPPTIRYMVSEENISLGKFLIVGPADTPYEGGYFLFDLQLPSDYPNTSPKVNFLTTGGGSVRFNPNLYNCGKVCLSLLGTWSGEKWNPAVSNINQVLQSICYLIFVEEPYFNEPGYHRSESSLVESKKYNTKRRRSTVRAAFLDHLTHPDPYFGTIIHDMMITSWDKTKEVFESWAAEDGSSADIRSCITRIEEKLLRGG